MLRRAFLLAFSAALFPLPGMSHSPWGQYAVYRQKHLLVLSTREDAETYPYSKRLVEAINKEAPEARARPARAINLERVYNLLRTDQFQFALLSQANVEAMRSSAGPFVGRPPVDLSTIYQFDDLEFVVRADFPKNLVAIVTHAVLTNLESLPGALPPQELLTRAALHAGAREAIEHF